MPEKGDHWTHKGTSLFTHAGERKYLNPDERKAFYQAIPSLQNPMAETFCEMIFWTGCRPSEALTITAAQIDKIDRMVVIESLKKRNGQVHYRPIPLPDVYFERLLKLHDLGNMRDPLWRFKRTTAWAHMARVMKVAGITGDKACARGLRHSLGVTAAMTGIPINRIQRWLWHGDMATTSIYLDVSAKEDRTLAQRMWD